MKRILSIFLCLSLILSGCGKVENIENETLDTIQWVEIPQEYNRLNDEKLLGHVEDLVYRETVTNLNNEEYFVENVRAIYISQEYLDELSYNSQNNIYFGFSLEELNEIFNNTKYVFTLSDTGDTTVKKLDAIKDASFDTIMKNVAVGTGVILVCVTVSAVTAGVGAPAVSLIFATAAKTATTMAISSAGFGAISAGVVRGIETGDMSEALEAAALSASEGFKWGAITGAITGGSSATVDYSKAMKALKGVELNGITSQQAAYIQMKSKYPVDVIKQFTNFEQYKICQTAGLQPQMVNGNTVLVRKIDLNLVDEAGRTNLERMREGLAALNNTGTPFELHHIGQKADSTLAILTKSEHMQGENNKIWHVLDQATDVHTTTNNWDSQRRAFWKALAESLGG